MLDIRRIRSNPEEVIAALSKRQGEFAIDKVVELDEKRGYSIVDDSGGVYVYMKYRFIIVDNSPVETNYKKLRAVKSKFNGKKVVLGKNSDYIVVYESANAYFVINDCGQIAKYPKSYFIE